MSNQKDTHGLVNELLHKGFSKEQEARFQAATESAKIAAVVVMTARHGASEYEVVEALKHSKNLYKEFEVLYIAATECHEFVLFVHSGTAF